MKVGGKWGASSRLFPAAMVLRHLRIPFKAARSVLDESVGVAAMKRASQQQAEAVCAILLARAASLSATDLEIVTELVDEVGFEVEGLTSVLDVLSVVARSLKRRRGAQTLDPQILHYFTASDWMNMLSESATIGTVLDTILGRVYLLGGINLSEYTSKFLTALLMHVQRTDERNDHKKKLHTYVKLQHKNCLLYTSPSPRDRTRSRMPSSA